MRRKKIDKIAMLESYAHAFDTHKHIKALIKSGFKEVQAEALVNSLIESREYDFSKLATRDQLKMTEERLEAKITSVEERLEAKITLVEERLDAKITSVEERLERRISDVKHDLLKWIMPFLLAIVGMIASIIIK